MFTEDPQINRFGRLNLLDSPTPTLYTLSCHSLDICWHYRPLYTHGTPAMNRYMPLVIMVVLGQATIAYFLVDLVVIPRLVGPGPEDIEEARPEATISSEPESIYRDLGTFIINPADTANTLGLKFLLTDITMGISPASAYDMLMDQNPILRDAVIRIFSGKAVEEMDSPEEREFIKDEIKFAADQLLSVPGLNPSPEVLQVNFIEFVIQ